MKQSTVSIIVVAVILVAAGFIGAAIQYGNNANNAAQNGNNNNQAAVPAEQNNNNMDPKAGLGIEEVKVGTGAAANTGDSVTVHYTGTFADGKKFDSSVDRGEPFTFTLGGQVIQGWNEGVVGMQVGGTRKLVIPPALGYGAQDYGPIPGNSTLYFTIELLKIGQ